MVVVLLGGRSFGSDRTNRLSDMHALTHAKAQLSSIIRSKSVPVTCLVETTSAFALVDVTVSLFVSSS